MHQIIIYSKYIIEEAKLGISKKLGVPPNCIEITIRA